MKELGVLYRKQIGLQKASRSKEGLYGGESDLYWFCYILKEHATGIAPTFNVAEDMGFTRQ